jgi:hypothetical protein
MKHRDTAIQAALFHVVEIRALRAISHDFAFEFAKRRTLAGDFGRKFQHTHIFQLSIQKQAVFVGKLLWLM